MTRNEARAYFRAKGLTYDNVTLDDLHLLKEMLDKHFILQRIEQIKRFGSARYWNRVNPAKYYKGEFTPAVYGKGRLIRAAMTASGEYFTARSVITFYSTGEIEFCVDADEGNTAPVLAAFVEWCDWLAGKED